MADKYLPKTDHQKLAMEFLTGVRVRDSDGHETHRYLEPGSDEELMARMALCYLIWQSNLHESIRLHLIMLLNPVDSELELRKLVFRFRSRGKRSDGVRDRRLAIDVALKVALGTKVEAAIQEVMTAYGVTRSTAFRIWEKHGKSFLADFTTGKAVATSSEEITAPIAGLGRPPKSLK